MSQLWALFPFTTLARGSLTPGAISPPLSQCESCLSKPCAADAIITPGEVKTCRYGVDYSRIDDERVAVSFSIAKQFKVSGRARRIHKDNPRARTTLDAVHRAVKAARAMGPGVVEDVESARRIALEEAKADPALAEALRRESHRDVENDLARSHDFQQFAKLILQYSEALLRERAPDTPVHEAAEQFPTEGSIYFASRLMISKVDALVFIDDPLRARDNAKSFPFHSLFRQYTLLYQWNARQKKINLGVEGETYRHCSYNKRAVGSVIHALLDNLVKYAPARSKAIMKIEESGDRLTLRFVSLGPRIEDSEAKRIFDIGVRGIHAHSSTAEGQGIGLASALAISDVLGLNLRFEQKQAEDRQERGYHETIFSFDLVLQPLKI